MEKASVGLALMTLVTGERLPAHIPLQSVLALTYLAVFGSIIALLLGCCGFCGSFFAGAQVTAAW